MRSLYQAQPPFRQSSVRQLPGVGISIGLTRLFYVLSEQGLLSDEIVSAPADALVIPMTEDISFAVRTATVLRDRGVRTQLYTEQKKFKAKMSYAGKAGFPYVVLIGEDEIALGAVALKNMETGEQLPATPERAAEIIAEGVARRNAARLIKE